MWAKTKLLAGALFIYGGSYFLFAEFGDFSRKQSFLLAALMGTVVEMFWALHSDKPRFEPFEVSIKFMASALLDNGLVDESGLEQLRTQLSSAGAKELKEYHVLTDGINFSLLSPFLFYRNDLSQFQTHLNFGGAIPELAWQSKCVIGTCEPALYVKESFRNDLAAWEIGLIANTRDEVNSPRDITLAILPKVALASYYGRWPSVADSAKTDAALSQHGWRRNEHDCNSLHHKHLWLRLRHI